MPKIFYLISVSLIFLMLSSCSTFNKKDSTQKAELEKNKFITDFTNEVQKFQILADCRLHSPTGEKIRFSKENLCLFFENGNLLKLEDNHLVMYDKTFKKLSAFGPYKLHHQLSQSIFNSNLLSIDSQYYPHKKYKNVRYDVLALFNEQGKKIKSFNFYNYFKKLNKKNLTPTLNIWTTDHHKNNSYEMNHINSFKELYSGSGTNKKLTGYVAHCNFQNVIYILNPELTEIVRTIELKQKLVHDVQPYNENQLIYYMNQDASAPPPQLSSIELYDLKENKFSTLYQIKSLEVSSLACSSVQLFGTDKLLITHSKCLPRKGVDDALGYFFEYVDLTQNKSALVRVYNSPSPQSGYLINANNFLNNNIGH